MINSTKNILILGASGMLGSAILNYFLNYSCHSVKGFVRSRDSIKLFPKSSQDNVFPFLNIDDLNPLEDYVIKNNIEVIINCVGVIKQLEESNDPLLILPANSIFPHKISSLCARHSIRFIHMSTDCVFSGNKGMYKETDTQDSNSLYGLSKYLGEVDKQNTVTLRTSIIGHELSGSKSLIDWFLSQNKPINGFDKAIFSGLPTIEIARVIDKFILTNPSLQGLFHLSAEPIDKYSLLELVAKIYDKIIKINKDSSLKIDRSLNSDKFRNATGYSPEKWPELIKLMHKFR